MSIDVESARRDTPGCENVAHLNNAGAALPPAAVTEAVIGHLRREAETGGYEAAADAADEIERPYLALARLLGCEPAEIALTENGTRAWDMACYALPFLPGQRVLTTRVEYASNMLAFLQLARRRGIRIELVDHDEHGQISLDDLRRRIDADVALIALTHVPSQ